MYMKRNVRKHNSNAKPIVKEKTPMTLNRKGYGKYRYPKFDEIPGGPYFSKVMHAEFSETRGGVPSIDLFYKMTDAYTCWKIDRGVLPADTEKTIYYIRQRCPKDSVHYDKLEDSMEWWLELKKTEFFPENIIGATEYVWLEYEGKSDLATFKNRGTVTWEEFLDIGRRYFGRYSQDDEGEEEEPEVEPGYELDIEF